MCASRIPVINERRPRIGGPKPRVRSSPGRPTLRAGAAALALTTLLGAVVVAASGAENWLIGTTLQKRLAQPVGISWSGSPLRQALAGLSRAQRVAVLIDRRVDPGQKLDLRLDDVPLEAALKQIARSRELGVCLLGPVAYFGPARVSRRLRTIAALRTEEIRRLPPVVGREFLKPKRIAWGDFATPRQLLAELTEQNGLRIDGLDRVAHDLWAAADLPPLSLVDRLTLILVQFDLTFEASHDGRTIRLVPVPEEVAVVRSYPGGRQPEARAEQLAALLPDAQVKVLGSRIYVKGLLEDHERITSGRPSEEPSQRPPQDVTRIRIDKLSVQDAPVGEVLRQIAARLKLDLRIDHQALEQAGVSLDRRISVDVKNVTVDELLREVIKTCPLKFHRRNNVVQIGPLE